MCRKPHASRIMQLWRYGNTAPSMITVYIWSNIYVYIRVLVGKPEGKRPFGRPRLRWEDINPLTPNDHYSGRTAPLTSKRFISYIYSPNTGTEYFKHGIYSPFFPPSKCSLFHNSNVFGSCFIHILYTECAKIKKNNSGTKRLRWIFRKEDVAKHGVDWSGSG